MVLDGTVVSPRKALATSPGSRPEPKQTKMSAGSIEGQYLYRLPAHITTEFCKVMDSLDRSDWLRFASRVLHDQVDLRLAERSERPTDSVLHRWGVQNGTVGELLHVLNDLKLLRARDIILRWSPVPPSDRPAPTPWPQPPPKPSFSDQLFSLPLKDQHQKPQSNMETRLLTPPVPRPLPRPGPPPSALRTDREKRLEDLDSPPRPPEWPTGVGGVGEGISGSGEDGHTHTSIHPFSDPFIRYSRWGAGAYPSKHRVQGRAHPGWDTSPHTDTHTPVPVSP